METLLGMDWQNIANVLHELSKKDENRDFYKALIDLEKFSQLVANVRSYGFSNYIFKSFSDAHDLET